MVNRNIQMKKKDGDQWNNLFPLTLMGNVFSNEGEKLTDKLINIESDFSTQLTNLNNELTTNIQQISDDFNLYKDNTNTINLFDFNVSGDGVSDDTNSFNQALTQAENENKTLFIPSGKYALNNIIIKTGIQLGENVQFIFNGNPGEYLIQIETNNHSFNSFILDGNNKDGTLLKVNGNNNRFNVIEYKNIELNTQTPRHCYGLYIKGNDNFIGHVSGTHLINGGYSNESFPQALGVEGNNNRFNVVKLENIASGLVTINNDSSLDHLTFVSNLWIENASDNGIYNLPDTSIHINDMYYNGNEEPAVFTGNDIFIDSFRIKGKGSRIGFQNVNNVRINHLRIERDSEGKTVGALFRTRTGNVLSGNISIGNISGELVSEGLGQQLMLLDTGVIEYLTIENMDLVHIVKGSKNGLSRWIWLDIVQQLKFGEIKYKIIDDENSFTSNDKFDMVLPSLIKQSFIKSFEVQIVNNDGATISPAQFRGFGFKQQLLDVDGLRMQTNIGPYARESTIGEPNTMNTIPSAGYWKKGEIFYSRVITQTGTIGWMCIESGNPGVWRELN